METVSDIPCSHFHYTYIPTADPAWEDMIDSAEKINSLSFKVLSSLGDINKSGYGQFIKVLRALSDFTCDRCGKSFGAVDSWGPERFLSFDSLSGLNIMAMDMVVGSKPVKAIPDWGMAMDNEERLINKLTTSTKCWFALMAHIEREVDEVLGSTQLMASALGRKMAPRLPRYFSDVVHTIRQGKEFHWSTASMNVDLKARNLEIEEGLPPDFQVIFNTAVERARSAAKDTEE
jgi:hypothetical protein